MMNVQKLAMTGILGLATVLSVFSANAATIPINFGVNSNTEILENPNVANTDKFEFTLSSNASVSAEFTLPVSGGFYSLSNFMLELYDSTHNVSLLNTSSISSYVNTFSLSAGDYYFKLTGTPTGSAGGKYDYNITISSVTPVPEANSLLMVALGMGVIMVYRKTRVL